MKLNRYSPQKFFPPLASIWRKAFKPRNSQDEIMHITQSLMEKTEQKEELSVAELERLVCSFIPESCDECVWLSYEDRASCPSQGDAPCRIYLNKVINYLEDKGLI